MQQLAPAGAIDATALQPYVFQNAKVVQALRDRVAQLNKSNPKAATALGNELRPLLQSQQQLEHACAALHRMHSSPLTAAEIAGKFFRPYGVMNRFMLIPGTIAENMEAMGRPAKNDTTFKLFEQKYGQAATELGFGDEKATEFHVGTFDKDARIPNGDLCEIYTFELDLRKKDYTAVSEPDRMTIAEARVYLVVNGNNPVLLGEMGDFERDVSLSAANTLTARRPVTWNRPLAVVRHDDNVAVHIVFPEAAADIKDNVVGRFRAVGPYYTEYGGLVG